MSFLGEVADQGMVLRDLVSFYRGEGDGLLCSARHRFSHHIRSVVFIGMGTSEFVPHAVRSYLGDKTVPILIWEAGEMLHYGMQSIREDDTVVAISQSGESVETRKVVEDLWAHHGVISVTNDEGSSIATRARVNLPILAGEEASISNKTYTNSLAVMLLLSRALAGEDYTPLFGEMERVSEQMDDFLVNREEDINRASEFLSEADALHFIARGPAIAAARQAALTYAEGAHLFTCALPGGSMRHGPFEMVGPGHHAVMFAPDGPGGDLVRSMASEMAGLGSRVALFSSTDMPAQPNLLTVMMETGDPELFSLACAVPQALLLDRMAADRGLTAGVFARGGKITTVE